MNNKSPNNSLVTFLRRNFAWLIPSLCSLSFLCGGIQLYVLDGAIFEVYVRIGFAFFAVVCAVYYFFKSRSREGLGIRRHEDSVPARATQLPNRPGPP